MEDKTRELSILQNYSIFFAENLTEAETKLVILFALSWSYLIIC